ncbi:MAG: hypothetical protein IJX99_10190 [Clostridia bacterium]|nr:hypothetical protein [Clostridia bacterium]
MIKPNWIKSYDKIDLKLGIKSSLPNEKATIALLYLIWKVNGKVAEVAYSKEVDDKIVISDEIKDDLLNLISSYITQNINIEEIINNNQLFASQIEALIVAFELVWRLAKIEFSISKAFSSERTGGKRYSKKILYTKNIDELDLLVEQSENNYLKVLCLWLIGENVTDGLKEYEENISKLLTLFSEEAIYKMSDKDEEIIFNMLSVYDPLVENPGKGVNISSDEPKGSFRILKNALSEGINPYVKLKDRNTIVSAENKANLKEYSKRVDNYLSLTNLNLLNNSYTFENVEVNEEIDNKEVFRRYYFSVIENVTNNAKEEIDMLNEFQEEYPLQRIRDLSLDEYALGKVGKEKTLSYKLEFGKYKGIVGIGGGTSKKHGAFWRNKGETLEIAGQNIAEDETDEKWNEFRNELYTYLNEYGTSNDPLKRKDSDEYSLLKGMDIVLTKMLFQYYPDRFVSVVSKSRLIELLDYFEYNYEGLSTAEDLNFALTKQLKKDFEFLENKNLLVTGWILWGFLFDVILHGENYEENDEEDPKEIILENYNKENFLDEVYINEEKYDDIVSTLKMKKNIILEGAPRSWKNIYGKKVSIFINGMY